MGSNRTIQTILQAIMVVLLAALVFKLPGMAQGPGLADGGGRSAAEMPTDQEIKNRFRAYFSEDKEASSKVDGLTVSVRDISLDGPVAYVKLQIQFKWEGHNVNYTDGPLKNAPGNRGDTVQYSEVFKFRRWSKGWDIEGRREPPVIQ